MSLNEPPLALRPLTGASLDALITAVGTNQVSTRSLDVLAASRDASHYQRLPSAVVTPRNANDVAEILRQCGLHDLHAVFRSGGTSLSGQAGTDGVLIDTRRHFKTMEILDDGRKVRCEPGLTVRHINARLAPYGRKLGPDPASEIACTIGGVIANNSSGMECGIERNAYRTIESAVITFASGVTVDTADRHAREHLAAAAPALLPGLAKLRNRVRNNPRSVAVIDRQYSIKNTMGYAINALVDFDDPLDILLHLMVGSEGTLGFVSSVTLRTVAVPQTISTGLVVFENIAHATAAIRDLTRAGARTLELMDASSLRVAQNLPGADTSVRELDVHQHTALLVDVAAESVEILEHVVDNMMDTVDLLPIAQPAQFTSDPRRRGALWAMRKGLYPALAGRRRPGSAVLLEDVGVPVDRLSHAVSDLARLLKEHRYDDSVIFGHAKDGNLHFMISPDFSDAAEVRNYEEFTEELVELVLGQDGTLKAEHGTGHIMAPYVRRQFGDELHDVMRRVKDLFDPRGTLGPNVLMTSDPTIHVRAIKTLPVVDPALDACVDCGYCETVCPSRDVTTTPRQRIGLLREAAKLDPEQREDFLDGFAYEAVQTCAADSLCATVCPVGIDTGALMKRQRTAALAPSAQALGKAVSENFGHVSSGLRLGLAAAARTPELVRRGSSRALRRNETIAEWLPDMAALPKPGRTRKPKNIHRPADFVYFPSCVGTFFGSEPSAIDVGEAFTIAAGAAGLTGRVPASISSLCCGTPWASKGLRDGYTTMSEKVAGILGEATENGRIPVVADASSCSHGLANSAESLGSNYEVLDSVTFVARAVLPRLGPLPKVARLALHATCSSAHLENESDLLAIAETCGEEVYRAPSRGCCGFAGDRGLLHPELTEAATESQAAEIVAAGPFDAYVSSNRPCEMGMSRATGANFVHVLQLLAERVKSAQHTAPA